MVLFDILRYSFSSMIWGILIAVACMALFVFLIKGWYKDATFSPISYAVGATLFLFLSFQCILVVGSLKIISMTDEYEQRITSIVESAYSPSDMVSMQGLGYRQMFDYLEGICTLDEAVERIKKETRHFAKRQLTWFRREPDAVWIRLEDFGGSRKKILEKMTEESLRLIADAAADADSGSAAAERTPSASGDGKEEEKL